MLPFPWKPSCSNFSSVSLLNLAIILKLTLSFTYEDSIGRIGRGLIGCIILVSELGLLKKYSLLLQSRLNDSTWVSKRMTLSCVTAKSIPVLWLVPSSYTTPRQSVTNQLFINVKEQTKHTQQMCHKVKGIKSKVRGQVIQKFWKLCNKTLSWRNKMDG